MSKNNINLEDMPSMEELLGGQTNVNFQENTLVKGRVAEKTDKGVLLDIGYKAEALVDRQEIKNWDTIQVGDELEVYLEQIEDEENIPVVSIHKAELQKAWDSIVANYEEGGLIKGTIRNRVKGGLIVDVGVEAFLPGSQVDLGPARNLDDYVGKQEDFKILKINAERRNIVLSRRELLEAARAEQRTKLMDELIPKQIRRGVVKNITEFGAFVDLNGMDGLLHITDMSWGRVSHPSEVVKVGEEIEVMILEVDRERQRVSLGLKQKEGNPWDTVDVKYPKDSRIKGRVVNVMPYGAFVELEEGIEGLIHVSEMSWTKKVNRASDILHEGDEVEAVVLDVNKEDRKISLGLRQTQSNPWEVIKERYPKGTRIKGKVRNMTGYGAFVQIQDDIDGMIHVSDMSWIRKINHPSEVLQKGMEVEAVILDVDADHQRISLSMKKLTDDPWQTIQNKYQVGDVVEGKITKLASFGAFVELEGGIDGLIHISELSDERVNRVKDVVQVGDTVKARVKNINTDERRIGLSMKDATEGSEIPTSLAALHSNTGNDLGGLGGMLDDAFQRAQEETEKATDEAPADEDDKATAAAPANEDDKA
ncbi:small subunit ribosomal protein S1 [Oligosphaera ethanolica]|uniref:Small ribosomal subunit protein bS1 n=2 Tax=Oligosphaera ethanolica TaxID=760260 RepID=A0AAE3VEI3_9BACT|nr:small subunit ribosomal protein S1 [Oligosphaera ethanolica]